MKKSLKEEVDKLELYNDIAVTLSINRDIVKKVCEYQFKRASSVIYKGEDTPVKFPYIGKIIKQL